MFTISKEFHFSAAHQLDGLHEGHPCGRLHGHNYIVRVTLTGDTLDEHGFLLDYNDLKPFGAWLDAHLDHKNLNDVLPIQPTAENLAQSLAGTLREVVAVPESVTVQIAVSETPKTWAEWKP